MGLAARARSARSRLPEKTIVAHRACGASHKSRDLGAVDSKRGSAAVAARVLPLRPPPRRNFFGGAPISAGSACSACIASMDGAEKVSSGPLHRVTRSAPSALPKRPRDRFYGSAFKSAKGRPSAAALMFAAEGFGGRPIVLARARPWFCRPTTGGASRARGGAVEGTRRNFFGAIHGRAAGRAGGSRVDLGPAEKVSTGRQPERQDPGASVAPPRLEPLAASRPRLTIVACGGAVCPTGATRLSQARRRPSGRRASSACRDPT